jgi:carbon-monoxide dehydrogenase large subunit
MTTQVFGSSIKRREDPRLITGQGNYVDDIKLLGMLHVAFVRSPHAHANIKSVETSKAEALEGVVAVFTGAEMQEELGELILGWILPEQKKTTHAPMAFDRVTFVGESVAVVVAETPEGAEDGAELVDVDYETLPVVVDAEKATAPGAPLVHAEAPNNIAWEWEVNGGDVDAAAAQADVVVKQRIINQRLIPNPIETRGIVADYDKGSNQLTIWTSTQVPHLVRLAVAISTGHPEHKMRVVAPDVGGGFGSKICPYVEEMVVAIVAKRLARPVKWIEGRQENYLATNHGRDHIQDVEIMGNRDGTITGRKATVYANQGAHLSFFASLIPSALFALMHSGPYSTPNISCKVYGTFTNTTPVDAYRGAGRPEATYLLERMTDMFAQEIGMDPVKVRRKNLIPPFDDGYDAATGVTYDTGNYEPAFDKALEMVGYQQFRQEQEQARKEGRYLGIGVSTYVEICGLAPSAVVTSLGLQYGAWESALVRFHPTGKVTLYTGSSSHGQGHETTFAQLAASELGIPMEDIEIVHGDTSKMQFGVGTFGSRSAAVGGTAIHMAVEKVKDKAKRLAAHLLEAAEEDIVYEDGKLFVTGAPAEGKTIQEIAFATHMASSLPEGMEPGLEALSYYDPKNFTWPFGTHVCVVEVDPDTGEVKLLRYIAVDDVGTVINPMIVDGMVHGGVAQGIGQALLEEAIYDESGQLLTGSMMDYAIPKAEDMPTFELERTETPSTSNPLGIKGAGETGTIAAAPAVINAVVDALSPFGVKHIDMPATPEKVWRLMQESKS